MEGLGEGKRTNEKGSKERREKTQENYNRCALLIAYFTGERENKRNIELSGTRAPSGSKRWQIEREMADTWFRRGGIFSGNFVSRFTLACLTAAVTSRCNNKDATASGCCDKRLRYFVDETPAER